MNKTKIEWCTHTWNPVTGCKRGCPYCYAKSIANTYGTNESRFPLGDYIASGELVVIPGKDTRTLDDAMFELNAPLFGNPYPFRFRPTFRRYPLDEPAKARKPRDIFVCSMADLFGDWVPLRWIRDVFDACAAAPQHRYLFLTKNPLRYWELDKLALLPHEDNFWYGVTVTDYNAQRWYRYGGYHLFWSVEPLLGPLEMWRNHSTEEAMIPTLPEWVIIGAETGRRTANKVTPKREWVDRIAEFCKKYGVPVFYKDNLRTLFPDLPPSEFPW